jgi:DNA polymerase-3 subunit gamma/tau
MAFEITAAKRRPQKFSELAGQAFVVSTLENSLQNRRIAHAYLFSGPRGVGKTSAARILAKSLNCETGVTDNPCGTCASCREITSGSALDVIEIDGASNTSVNDVRAIKDEVLFAPNSSPYKIYIIDEVHMLSNSAFNALLKTIEEPPPYIVFIFATTEVHKVPATIRSRCQQFHFQLISLDVIIQLLKEAADQMGITYEEDALFWIAKEATGSLRDAYTLFDQILSFCDGNIRMELIREKMGLVGVDVINRLAEHLSSGSRSQAIELLHKILAEGVSVEKCIIDLAEYFRTLLLIKEGITKESLIGSRAEVYSQKVLSELSSSQIEAALDLLLNLYREIRFSLNQRFELELAVSRLSSVRQSCSPSSLITRIEQIRSEITNTDQSSFPPNNQHKGSPPTPRESVEPAHPNPEKKAELVLSAKHIEILQAKLKQSSPSLASALQQLDSWSQDGVHITLSFSTSFAAEHAKQRVQEITGKLSQIVGQKVSIKITLASEQKRPEHQNPGTQEHADDAVMLVKNIFRGEIESKTE